ncbi:uncharacterized protein DUF1778 [Klebsiella oxytoca]|uniref:Uncharacterized protein DUF1778 n=1 Tax=Klebsiella oxytoca TaxID=571 RepID=A0A318FH81_KLEOX|nr:uncharacterized protein DUF1778 [Klebsiella oxytoca]
MLEDICLILPNDSLRIIEAAAAISSETVPQFILRSSYDCAVKIIEHYNSDGCNEKL